MKIEKISSEMAKTKEKISLHQSHLRDLEKLKTEQENIEILQAIRSITVSPEEVRALLSQIKTANQSYLKNEKEITQNDEEKI